MESISVVYSLVKGAMQQPIQVHYAHKPPHSFTLTMLSGASLLMTQQAHDFTSRLTVVSYVTKLLAQQSFGTNGAAKMKERTFIEDMC